MPALPGHSQARLRKVVALKIEGSIEFSVVEQTADRVVSEMPIQAGMKNPFGSVHAGAILWFADVSATYLVMGSAQASEAMRGFPLAINLNANFIANQTEGTFKAVSSFVKRGGTVSIVRTLVYGDGEKLIADITTNHVLSK
jgi:1,4-dihydroxy-2-naphthoyl-CoA hydrolase